jgi:hypothetical protein
MPLTFDEDGVRFLYPENWKLEREAGDDGWTVTVQSPETAFFLLSLDSEGTDTQQLLATALETLKADYPDLEAEECVDTIAGQPAIGHDIRFISLDLTNTCWTRALLSTSGTLFILCQSNDLESEVNEKVLRAICASLKIED